MTPWAKRAAVVVVLGALLVGSVVLLLQLPSYVAGEAGRELASRSGWQAEVGDVELGLSGTTLLDLRLSEPGGPGRISLQAVALDADLLALAMEGAGAISRVDLRGGTISLTLTEPDPDAAAAAAPARPASAGGASTARRIPDLDLRDLEVELIDEEGSLVRLGSLSGRLSAGLASVAVDDAELGTADELIRVSHAEVEVDRAQRSLSTLSVRGVDVPSGEDDSSVLARLRRFRTRALERLAPSQEESESEDASPTDYLSLLSPTFSGTVDDVTIRRAECEEDCLLLSELGFTLRRSSDAALHTVGNGRPQGGGRVEWDLSVTPRDLRATGSLTLEELSLAALVPFLPDMPLYEAERGRISAELTLEGAGDRVAASGRLAVRDLALEHPRLAAAPIRSIAFAVAGEATYLPLEHRLEIASASIESGRATATAHGAIEWAPDHYLFDLDLNLPVTPCGDALSGIPAGFLAEATGFTFSGRMGANMRVQVDSRDLDATVLRLRVADGCRFETVPQMADLSRFQRPFVHTVEEPEGAVFEMETGPGTAAWTPIERISPFLVHAVLGHEDGAFFSHSGFSPYSIREALVRNLRAGRYVLGASTISMQLVKNIFLHRQKTLARKVQEVLLTWWVESALPKERILELYLNVIEYGPSVYGIRNASQHYFGVEPAELSPAQSAYLAMILPNPPRYHGHYEAGELPPGWVGRLQRFLDHLGERGRYDAEAVADGRLEATTLRFQRAGAAPALPRVVSGHAAPLPYGSMIDDSFQESWDEAMDAQDTTEQEAGGAWDE